MGVMIVVTLIVVGVIVVVALIILIGLVVFTQKHRANKRKRLEGSLMQGGSVDVWCLLGDCLIRSMISEANRIGLVR